MSKQLIDCICAGFLLITWLTISCQANKQNGRDHIQKVLDKLDAYALESESSGSGLTIEELELAHEEYNNWNNEYRQEETRSNPLLQLLHDFLFQPMERFRELIGFSDTDHEAYIRRLEMGYKKFRASYFNKLIGHRLIKSPKTTQLVDSIYQLEGAKPLTMKLFRDAQIEFNAFNEIIREKANYEDIYSELNEYEAYRNYFAWPTTKVLAKRVFPSLSSLKEAKFPELRKFFIVEAEIEGMTVVDGKLKLSPSINIVK